MSLVDVRKCLICKCTDERACPGGCSWELLDPPVRSSCIVAYVMAALWKGLFDLEAIADTCPRGRLKRSVAELRAFYDTQSKRNGERFPSFRKIRAILRADMKFLRGMRQRGSLEARGAKVNA